MPGAAPPTVLHGKFSSWLPWHQPFLDDLLRGLDASFHNVVLCNRVENLERFPRELVALKSRALLQPAAAAICAAELRARVAPALLHGHFGWSGLRLLLLKALLRVPLVVSFGGRDAGVQLAAKRSAPAYRVLLAGADRLLCVSHALREQLLAAGAPEERTCVVHRGTDLARFPFVDRAERPPGPLRILMVGRLVEKKGHADALAALRRLLDAGHRAELAVVGAGPARAAILAEAARLGVAGALELAEPTDRAGLVARFSAADVFLHCSVTTADGDVEGIPNVVVEAAATGLPVVGTRHGGIAEAIEEGRGGLLVGERDAAALAAALERLAKPELRLALGRAAAERVRRDFDLRAQVAAHAALYRELLAGPAPRPVALPDDWFAIARRAVGGGARAWDHAQAEVVAALVGVSLPDALAAAPRGALDRAAEAPTAWPRPWRSGAELALDLAARVPLPGRAALRAARARSMQRAEALDRAVLARLRDGAELAGPPPERWAAALRELRGEPPPTGWRKLRERIAGGGADGDEG